MDSKDTVNVDTVPASAPSSELVQGSSQFESSPSAFFNDELRFLEPTLLSHDDFAGHVTDWIREPESKEDFFNFISEQEYLEQNKHWIWEPNANTEGELLSACNKGRPASRYTNRGGLIGTTVLKGEILFCTNRNQQKVYGEGMHTFYKSYTKVDGQPINIYQNTYVRNKAITIVTLQPNQIAVALDNQKPVLLLPGRHAYHNAQFDLQKKNIYTISDFGPRIKHEGGLTCVRVGEWEIGFGYDKGKPILLKPGLHLSNDPSFAFVGTYSAQEEKLGSHDCISLIRIDQKDYGCAVLAGSPVLLLPGFHVYNNPSFAFEKCVDQTKPYIKFYNLHIIQVANNQFGLGWEGNKPVLVAPGIWKKNSPLFRFDGFRRASEQKIEHGSITRFQVKQGEIGFAWWNGEVKEIPPGIGIVDDPNFQFVQTFDAYEPVIQFGNIAYVTTQEAHCRPVYINGKVQILEAGSIKFTEPNLRVSDQFTTAEIILTLHQIEVLTRDRTPMLVTGQVNYQIMRPRDLVFNLGYQKLGKSIEATVQAILRHAFSITDLSTISPDNNAIKELEAKIEAEESLQRKGERMEAPEDEDDKNPDKDPLPMFRRDAEDGEGQNFRGSLCHEVHTELIRLTQSWGIDVKDLAISDIQFKDQAVADKLANATSNTRTAEAEYDLTLAEARIRLEKAQANAQEQLVIQTNGAKIKKIDAENNSQTTLIQKRAEAEAAALTLRQEMQTEAEQIEQRAKSRALEMNRLAQARADEMQLLAKAERDADLLRAEGQKALAEAQIVQYSSPQVLQLEMMKLYVEACKAMATAPTPAVLLQQSGSNSSDANASGGKPGMSGEAATDLLNVFRKQGKYLLGAAMQGDSFVPSFAEGQKPTSKGEAHGSSDLHSSTSTLKASANGSKVKFVPPKRNPPSNPSQTS